MSPPMQVNGFPAHDEAPATARALEGPSPHYIPKRSKNHQVDDAHPNAFDLTVAEYVILNQPPR